MFNNVGALFTGDYVQEEGIFHVREGF